MASPITPGTVSSFSARPCPAARAAPSPARPSPSTSCTSPLAKAETASAASTDAIRILAARASGSGRSLRRCRRQAPPSFSSTYGPGNSRPRRSRTASAGSASQSSSSGVAGCGASSTTRAIGARAVPRLLSPAAASAARPSLPLRRKPRATSCATSSSPGFSPAPGQRKGASRRIRSSPSSRKRQLVATPATTSPPLPRRISVARLASCAISSASVPSPTTATSRSPPGRPPEQAANNRARAGMIRGRILALL